VFARIMIFMSMFQDPEFGLGAVETGAILRAAVQKRLAASLASRVRGTRGEITVPTVEGS
jgi:hypothetical protein